jgi:NADPH:quinone reductase-like Zn-dependent oxidoreductase
LPPRIPRRREDLGQVLELLRQGALTAQIAKRFALTDAGAALRYAEGRGITGKGHLVPDTT